MVIGDDHRFGRNRGGDFSTLQTLGEALGFEVEALDTHRVDDVRVSSTKVREALRAGNVAEANLGWAHLFPPQAESYRATPRVERWGSPPPT